MQVHILRAVPCLDVGFAPFNARVGARGHAPVRPGRLFSDPGGEWQVALYDSRPLRTPAEDDCYG
jgi:hypothetical protein